MIEHMFELLATVEGFDLDVGDLVARLAEAQPGPQVVMVLAALDAPPAAAAAAAPPGAASGAVGPVELAEGDPDWTREEVAAALRLSGQTAHRRLTVARTLEHQLPGTWTALAEGRISYLPPADLTRHVIT